MAGPGKDKSLFRASLLYHCASVPPGLLAGMFIQAFVPRMRGSAAGGPGILGKDRAGRSGRILCSFSGVQTNNYWSSTTNANNTSNAWNVNLNNGNVNNNNKTNNNYVWPVRGGE